MAPTTEPKQRSPSIVVQELTHEKIRFALLHTDTSVANALRRVIIAEVPTLAIDLVDVIENTSCLCDEFIAHRLGLIPLLSEKAVEMEFPYDYAGDDESVTDVHFELNTGICASAETVDVTSNDLVCYDPRVAPVNYHPGESIKGKGGAMEFEAQSAARGPDDGPDIPGVVIVKLRRGQQINMRCVARKGVGRDHAKWQPVATATYRFEPEITINEELMATLTEEEKMAFVESSPTALFRYDEATRRVVVDAPDQARSVTAPVPI
jgi:DNA-directed RNA polymerase II subunit RPB3